MQNEPNTDTSNRNASSQGGVCSTEAAKPPIYEVRPIPGRGKGVIALTRIPRGTLVILDPPLLTISPLATFRETEALLATKLHALSKPLQRQFLSLHNNYPAQSHPFANTYKTNAHPCGGGGADNNITGVVYPTISRINHSCIPNAHTHWDPHAQHGTVHAIRAIDAGEEVTTAYISISTAAWRKAFLRANFGFECDCCACSRLPAEHAASDVRVERLELLQRRIVDPGLQRSCPEEVLADCREWLLLLDEEFGGCVGIHGAVVYSWAFRVCVGHGDRARAGVFVEMWLRERGVCEGESSSGVRGVRELVENGSWEEDGEFSVRWRTQNEEVPKGLGEEEFEKWLWRE